MMAVALTVIALGLVAVALVAAIGALMSRSLFAACLNLIAAGAAIAVMTLLLGAEEDALAVALLGAAWAPVLLLAAMLLSARTEKSGRRKFPWVAAACAMVMIGAAWAPLSALTAVAEIDEAAPLALGFWLAPMMLVAAAAAVGLLGYGERGALVRTSAAA